jgi:YCII-related domain-containing protein
MLSLYVKGSMKLAGPLTDNAGGAVVLAVADESEAKAIVTEDPAVKAGIFCIRNAPVGVKAVGQIRREKVGAVPNKAFHPRQEEFNRNIESLAKWIEGAIQRFRSGVKNSRVIELHDTNHYVCIVDEALVVREMRKFLLDE